MRAGSQLVLSISDEVVEYNAGRKTAKEAAVAVITRSGKAGVVAASISRENSIEPT